MSKTIGACHAGWRGAIDNIAEVTIASMESIGAKRKISYVLLVQQYKKIHM